MNIPDVAAPPAAFSSDSGIVTSPNSSFASWYPQSLNAPSVNFMMLPLCTSVTESRFAAIAYSIALRTSRFDPNSEIGLMPIAEPSRIFAPLRRSIALMQSMTPFAPSEPAGHSMPA